MSSNATTVGVVNGHTHSSPYGYTPSAVANIAFLSTFAILTLIHLVLGLKHRTWYFCVVMVLGGLGEVIGYVGRVGSAYDVTLDIYFIIQICCLIFAPAFFSAALYLAIGTLAMIVGRANSLLKPMSYIIIFSTFDVVALTVQALGGAEAAKAQEQGTSTVAATHLMEAGIIVQTCGNLVFTATAVLLWYRTRRSCRAFGVPTPYPKTQKFKLYVAAIIISDAAIIARAVYRVIELAQGWRGHLITTEAYFYCLDTAPMILCMAIWVIGHPGITLEKNLANPHLRTKGHDAQEDVNLTQIERY